MKIYSRTGDSGSTDTLAGDRLSKASDIIKAVGDIDELNSYIGLALASASYQENAFISKALVPTQHELFVIGAQISAAGSPVAKTLPDKISPDTLARIEKHIDQATEKTPEMKSFIIPGGCELSARLHICRTVCRRTERSVVRVAELENHIPEIIITYLNRLSDLLFALARVANLNANQPDIFYHI